MNNSQNAAVATVPAAEPRNVVPREVKGTTEQPSKPSGGGGKLSAWRDLAMLFALGALFVFFTVMTPYFASPRNLSMLSIELSITAVLALGMLLIIVTGNIDLSAGSGVGLIGGIASTLVFDRDWEAPGALGVGLLVAVVLWSLMGSLIVYQRIPAFIITLGGLLVYKGLFWLVIRSQTIPVVQGGGENLYSMLTTYYLPTSVGVGLGVVLVVGAVALSVMGARARARYGLPAVSARRTYGKLLGLAAFVAAAIFVATKFRGVPLPLAILTVVALAVHFITTSTPFGRYLYAIGGNEDASRLSGVPVERVVVGAFGIMGVLVAITGFMQTAYAGASTTTVGDLMELDAVAACVIGGTSLKGGRGTVLGVIMGALIMATLINGMTLMAVSPEMKYIVRGGVLAGAVWLDVALGRRGGR